MNKKYKGLQRWFFLFLIGIVSMIYPQPAKGETWAKKFGTDNASYSAGNILETADGGYLLAGYFGGSYGFTDAMLLKLDDSGAVQWQKSYTINAMDVFNYLGSTTDGGFILGGYTGDSNNLDYGVMKVDAAGNHVWHKSYGGIQNELGTAVAQTVGGGYIAAGATVSFGAGLIDIWVLKLNAAGEILWQKTYGGSDAEIISSIALTADSGYMIVGVTANAGGQDIWILKLDGNGDIQWHKAYGNSGKTFANSLQQTTDGGYIIAGGTEVSGGGQIDALVLKLDSGGGIQWQKTYGGPEDDGAASIAQTEDGGYIVAGRTESYGAGLRDAWMLKLDASGLIQWQRTYGSTGDESVFSAKQTTDGGYIAVGQAGEDDIWVLKTHPHGEIAACNPGLIQRSDASGVSSNLVVRVPAGIITTDTTVNPGNGIAVVGGLAVQTSQQCLVAEPFIPMPTGQESFSYYPVEMPLAGTDPGSIRPVAVGDVEGGQVDISVELFETEEPVDVYFAFAAPLLAEEIFMLTSNNSFQPFSTVGFLPWKNNAKDYIGESITGKLPATLFPKGIYYLYLVITPANSLQNYYFWTTHFVIN